MLRMPGCPVTLCFKPDMILVFTQMTDEEPLTLTRKHRRQDTSIIGVMDGLGTSAFFLSFLTLLATGNQASHYYTTWQQASVVAIPPHSQEGNHNNLSIVVATIHQSGLKLCVGFCFN